MLVERFRYEHAQRYALAEEAPTTARRLEGGMHSLAAAIAATLPEQIITLNATVKAIKLTSPESVVLEVESASGCVRTYLPMQ